jgi:hypothetical protein
MKLTCTGESQRERTHARGRVSHDTRLRLHSVIAHFNRSVLMHVDNNFNLIIRYCDQNPQRFREG